MSIVLLHLPREAAPVKAKPALKVFDA